MQAALAYREIQFTHALDRPVPVVGHPGSMVRGVFGHALKAVLCPFLYDRDTRVVSATLMEDATVHSTSICPAPDCQTCVQSGHCAYAELFMQLSQRTTSAGDTPKTMLQQHQPEKGAVRAGKADQWPAPYVLGSALSPDGRTLTARLVLFGAALQYTGVTLQAIRGMGDIGFGNARLPMRLVELMVDGQAMLPDGGAAGATSVSAFTGECVPAVDGALLPVRFWDVAQPVPLATSIRIRFGGTLLKSRERQRQTDPLPFDVLLRALLRRQSLLAACHGQSWDLPFGDLVVQARSVRMVSCQLEPFAWQRTSSRTGQTSRYDAFCGEVTYEGDLTPCLPFLMLGIQTHVGSGTVFGMGRYEMKVLA